MSFILVLQYWMSVILSVAILNVTYTEFCNSECHLCCVCCNTECHLYWISLFWMTCMLSAAILNVTCTEFCYSECHLYWVFLCLVSLILSFVILNDMHAECRYVECQLYWVLLYWMPLVLSVITLSVVESPLEPILISFSLVHEQTWSPMNNIASAYMKQIRNTLWD